MDKEGIIKACKSSLTMAEAARKLNIPHNTFRRYAVQLGVYKPNQGQKGILRPLRSLEDVFAGKVKMRSYNIRTRLIQEGYKENKCEECGINEWNGKTLVLELDHRNGDHDDNKLENLQILCPNCHSQTPTFRGRK
jgi:ribosomal protein S14